LRKNAQNDSRGSAARRNRSKERAASAPVIKSVVVMFPDIAGNISLLLRIESSHKVTPAPVGALPSKDRIAFRCNYYTSNEPYKSS
ncbi:hypothetical protein, partial [Klebsiella pneumoniae]|uniref:hypothetical protein n=1 Tax=Klebsiella pneumoniae TaxID=573 RepID=UPI0030D979D8